jgi:hypothetical protein
MFMRNPIPTSGEIRIARSRFSRALGPVWGYLRIGALAGLGLGLAALGLRSVRTERPLALESGPADRGDAERGRAMRGLAERGAAVARAIGSQSAVRRATDHVSGVAGGLSSRAEVAVDEAHDLVEEAYGRLSLRLRHVRRSLTPPTQVHDRRAS